jgi:hypothetical protein
MATALADTKVVVCYVHLYSGGVRPRSSGVVFESLNDIQHQPRLPVASMRLAPPAHIGLDRLYDAELET